MKNKVYLNAPITLGFAALCALVLGLHYLTNGASTSLLFCTYRSSWADPLTYVRLFGHVLGHAGLSHFTSNMAYILLLGPILEEKYGKNLITIILVTALVTGLLHNFISSTALLGASGVCFAFILLASVTGKQKGVPVTLIVVALFWIGNEIYNGFTANDSISQITHIVGGLSGAGMGLLFKDSTKKSYLR